MAFQEDAFQTDAFQMGVTAESQSAPTRIRVSNRGHVIQVAPAFTQSLTIRVTDDELVLVLI